MWCDLDFAACNHDQTSSLKDIEMPEILVNDIIEGFLPNDIFNCAHTTTGSLSTEYRGRQFYEKHFSFVEPISLYLGLDKDNVRRYYEYVPIIKTIEEI